MEHQLSDELGRTPEPLLLFFTEKEMEVQRGCVSHPRIHKTHSGRDGT